MSGPSESRVAQLAASASVDPRAAAEILPVLYAELRKLARSLMAKLPPGDTLEPTALVHEAYMRLVGDQDPGWNGRGHFFGAAARAMRNILVDRARHKASRKAGGDLTRVDADDFDLPIRSPIPDVLALHEALQSLAASDATAAHIAELRYFTGMTVPETAAILGISPRTVEREWSFARAYLAAVMGDNQGGGA